MKKLSIGFVAEAIQRVKRENFGEDFVTCNECNYIAGLLEKSLKDKGYDIQFSIKISEKDAFDFLPGIIASNGIKDLSLTITDEKLKRIIYDKNFILFCLMEMQLEKLSKINLERSCRTCSSKCERAVSDQVCDGWNRHFIFR